MKQWPEPRSLPLIPFPAIAHVWLLVYSRDLPCWPPLISCEPPGSFRVFCSASKFGNKQCKHDLHANKINPLLLMYILNCASVYTLFGPHMLETNMKKCFGFFFIKEGRERGGTCWSSGLPLFTTVTPEPEQIPLFFCQVPQFWSVFMSFFFHTLQDNNKW